jgi:hypothetical protein
MNIKPSKENIGLGIKTQCVTIEEFKSMFS